ncbi:chromosome partitioning protein ParB [Ligilactobacillus salitolerans]|uniref:Chromosome partitioning protein ParB n=1 Tax=Ligilactobacillus salitolerans TaxID=1808352 RepID=A0A401IVF7_9LACO|nr:nucleoid occlusion protein [Ligilactobacillus salitolerans]GBG95486.1 chromosome partitioning protein ParB [Ligilactobacillus salitolerans]
MAFSFFGKNKQVQEQHQNDEVVKIPLQGVISNRFQPRQIFSAESISGLAETISQHGLLQPIIVREYEPKKYEIIAGERRFKAVESLKWTEIPAIIRKMSDNEAASMAVIENLQRESLTAIEEAAAYSQLMKLNGLTQGQLGQAIGKSQSFVANKMRLLKLSEPAKKAILGRKLSERHGRALLNLDEQQQKEILTVIEEKGLSVKETEALVEKMIQPAAKEKKPRVHTTGRSKNTRVALNTIKKSVKMVKDAGIKIKTSEEEIAGFHRVIIDIPVEESDTSK